MKNGVFNEMENFSNVQYDMENGMEYDSDGMENFNYGMENGGSYEAEASSQFYCLMCEQSHELAVCTNFIALSPDERTTLCKNNNVCFKCLKIGHRAAVCTARIRCIVCQGSHHGALHVSVLKGATPFVANRVTFTEKAAPTAPATPQETA